jgi:hypothetical protein
MKIHVFHGGPDNVAGRFHGRLEILSTHSLVGRERKNRGTCQEQSKKEYERLHGKATSLQETLKKASCASLGAPDL